MVRAPCFVLVVALLSSTAAHALTIRDEARPKDRVRLAVQSGHTRGVHRVLWSPDGRSLASASDDGSLKVWESETARIQVTLPQYGGSARWVGNAVAWSPGEDALAFARPDNSVVVWNRREDATSAPLVGHTDLVTSLAWSPDGGALVTGGRDGALRFRDAKAGYASSEPVDAGGPVNAVAWSATTNLVAAGGIGGVLAVVSPTDRTPRTTKLSGDVTYLAWSPDGARLLVKLEDSTTLVVDGASLAVRAKLEGASNVDFRAAWSPSGDAIASAGTYGKLRVWGADGTPRAGFDAPSLGGAVAWSPDGTRLADSGGASVRVLDARTGAASATFTAPGAEIGSVAWSPDGARVAAGAADGVVRVWDARAPGGDPVVFGGDAAHGTSAAWSPDGKRVAIGGDRTVVWDLESGRVERTIEGHKGAVLAVAWSPDGATLATGGADKTARLWDTTTWKQTATLAGHPSKVAALAWSPDGARVATGCGDPYERDAFSASPVRLWDARSGRLLGALAGLSGDVTSLAWRSDNVSLAAGMDSAVEVWSTATRKKLGRLEGPDLYATSVAWSPDGNKLAAGSWRTVDVWRVDALDTPTTAEDPFADNVTSVAWVGDGATLAAGAADGRVTLLDAETLAVRSGVDADSACLAVAPSPDGRVLISVDESGANGVWTLDDVAVPHLACALGSLAEGGWTVVDPDGRFDASDLDEVRGIHWVLSDDECRTLPIEIFMRQYYEPRLLPRLLAGESLPEIPSIARLNRARPVVRVLDARADVGGATATVRVSVAPGETVTTRSGARAKETSRAYDLRLFRDGQLVASAPERGGEVAVDPATGAATLTFAGIRLPSDARKTVEFSAYAFNVDRVKSATDRRTLSLPPRHARPRRAYVVTVGVNAGDDPELDLRFAANDARSLADAVGRRLADAKGYDEVVCVTLTSERDGARLATKARVRAVLDRLAGREGDAGALDGVENAASLRAATPDDLVVVAFSGHGFADRAGGFYLVPSDTGPDVKRRARAALDGAADGAGLDRFLSGAELADWLRDVDAGETALVVDACQSAASVAADGFKPGPMGSRGLGQLAYDKRLRVLAATQTDDVALESGALRHGLLTYALVRDGLEAWQADRAPRDGVVRLDEWLSYGVERVPALATEVAEKRVQTFGLPAPRLLVQEEAPGAPAAPPRRRVQQPALFDFSRGRATTLARASGR